MNRYKNEKGAALIITLMIVTLVLLFILTLFYQITNTTKQINTVEHTVDARLIAEMGSEYYQQNYKIKKQQLQNVMASGDVEQLKNEIIQVDNEIDKEIRIDENRKFKITTFKITSDSDKIVIHFKSMGSAFGKNETVESEIEVTLIEN